MSRFMNKSVLVIGGGSVATALGTDGMGNGRAAALLYAREGARVIVTDVNVDSARETQAMIAKEGGCADALPVDVESEASVTALFAEVLKLTDRIDVLHNNVGICFPIPTVEESVDNWDHIFRVNMRGTFMTCRAAIPVMVKQGGGAIVNISSISALRWLGRPMVAYSASKASLVEFTRQIALEHARSGVRANIVTPGFMDTPAIVAPYHHASGAELDAIRRARDATCPMGRMGDAWDIGHAALFLASDHARYITGVDLVVDGGLTCTINLAGKA